MATTKQTLFEQLNESKDEDLRESKMRSSSRMRVLIILLTIIFLTLFFPNRADYQTGFTLNSSAKIGTVWSGETIRAEYPFPVYKNERLYRDETRRAQEQSPAVFTLDTNARTATQRNLNDILVFFADTSRRSAPGISQEVYNHFLSQPFTIRRYTLNKFQELIPVMAGEVYSSGYTNLRRDSIRNPNVSIRISALIEQKKNLTELVTSENFGKFADNFLSKQFDAASVPPLRELAQKVIAPNLIFSRDLTQQEQNLAAQSVPRSYGIVRSNEVIISKGDRITEEILQKLQSYNSSRILRNEQPYSLGMFIGSLGHAAMIYSLLVLYLYFIRRKIFDDNFQLGGLSIILCIVAILAWLTLQFQTQLPIEYGVFIPAFSMLVAIIFDSRTAFYATVTMALLLSGIRGNDYVSGTAAMIAGTLAAYTVRDIQSRNQIFRSIFYILIGYAVAILSFGLERSASWNIIGQQMIVAGINSAVSPIITFGMLLIAERLFNVSSDIQLQEYDNLNHPLLLQLNEKAPGTYQHTLTIARLAESAARVIGANPLLAKVGSYYHDIGKLAKSEYFVENQINIDNKHDRLPPRKSVKIIRDHVEQGVELARQYKLPDRIVEFIPMHHGTTLIKHFYAKALEEAMAKGLTVKEDEFRYPGPRPNSKEAAIVMIADSVEALSRVVNTESREDIERAIDAIIRDRMMDGQFDNTELTMRDLDQIKEAFIKNLMGIHHHRTPYKEIPKTAQQQNADTGTAQPPAPPAPPAPKDGNQEQK